MKETTLKDALHEWSDEHYAEMAIAIAFGLMTKETSYQTDAKYVFNSLNPVGTMLHDFLVSLVRLGVLEHRETDYDDEYRWNPQFKGVWEGGTVKIEYREFWDVPRFFIIRLDCDVWLFDCRFDQSIDDYPECYRVYAISRDVPVNEDWNRISEEGRFLGEVKVANVKFDETKRQEMSLDFFKSFKFARQ
jgi:hypothetical protein